MRIRLGDADRERLGCPEWLTEDLDSFSVVEAELLQRAGIDPDDVVGEIYGAPVEGDDKVRRISMRGWRIRVWLALRRSGVKVPFEELDFDLLQFRKEAEPKPEGDAGKGEAESSSPDSASSTTP